MGLKFDELRSARKPREQTVGVPLDEDILQRIADIETRLPRERRRDEQENRPPVAARLIETRLPRERRRDEQENRPPVAARLEQELAGLKEEAEQAAEDFTFRELPRPVYRELIDKHPDTDGKLRWDEETFAPALLAACCVSHDFTEEQWKTLWDEWASWVVYPLFAAAYEVCEQPSRVPFGSRSSGKTGG